MIWVPGCSNCPSDPVQRARQFLAGHARTSRRFTIGRRDLIARALTFLLESFGPPIRQRLILGKALQNCPTGGARLLFARGPCGAGLSSRPSARVCSTLRVSRLGRFDSIIGSRQSYGAAGLTDPDRTTGLLPISQFRAQPQEES